MMALLMIASGAVDYDTLEGPEKDTILKAVQKELAAHQFTFKPSGRGKFTLARPKEKNVRKRRRKIMTSRMRICCAVAVDLIQNNYSVE